MELRWAVRVGNLRAGPKKVLQWRTVHRWEMNGPQLQHATPVYTEWQDVPTVSIPRRKVK